MTSFLNHVGVATLAIDGPVRTYRDMLDPTTIGDKFALPAQFLEKNPAGRQHHVCLEVEDIRTAAVGHFAAKVSGSLAIDAAIREYEW